MVDLLRQWEMLAVPVLVLILSQLIKIVLDWKKAGFALQHVYSYGGMPSTHTALFVSLTLLIGLLEGWSSPLFAVTLFVSAAFIRDAVGIRWSLGFHGKILNYLISTLKEKDRKVLHEKLEERLGHTPVEALVGGTLGLILTLLLHWLIQSA